MSKGSNRRKTDNHIKYVQNYNNIFRDTKTCSSCGKQIEKMPHTCEVSNGYRLLSGDLEKQVEAMREEIQQLNNEIRDKEALIVELYKKNNGTCGVCGSTLIV